MPQVIRMPSTGELPEGRRRKFVAELFVLYRQAGRPTLAEICAQMAKDPDRAGTASRETIRLMLLGRTVPRRWENVHAVVAALAALAARSDSPSPRRVVSPEDVRRLWDATFDDDPSDQRIIGGRVAEVDRDQLEKTIRMAQAARRQANPRQGI
jgi:hypothetical protein